MLIHLTYILSAPVRLGMQIAFGRVRRKTAPTGPGKWVVSNLECSNLLRLRFSPFQPHTSQQLGQSSPDRNDQQG